MLERSVVVVYGDYQAYIDETRLAGLLGFGKRSPYDSFRFRKKVPFLIRLPKGLAAGPKDIAGGHLDIAPTLLGVIGIIDDDIAMFGRDSTQTKGSFVVFRDGASPMVRIY